MLHLRGSSSGLCALVVGPHEHGAQDDDGQEKHFPTPAGPLRGLQVRPRVEGKNCVATRAVSLFWCRGPAAFGAFDHVTPLRGRNAARRSVFSSKRATTQMIKEMSPRPCEFVDLVSLLLAKLFNSR